MAAQDKDHELADDNVGHVLDLVGSPVLLVAFGGLQNRIAGAPPFEFLRMIGSDDVDKLFVRDLGQGWYQHGVRGHSEDIDSTASWLRGILHEHPHERVVTLGTSAGGFAALLFGSLLGVDQVLAFGPQTSIRRRDRAMSLEHRWKAQITEVRRTVPPAALVEDVRPAMRRAAGTRFDIWVGMKDPRDVLQARRLRRVEGVTIHHVGGGHNVAKTLRDAGELRPIVTRATGMG